MRYLTKAEFDVAVVPLCEVLGPDYTVRWVNTAGPLGMGSGYLFYASVSHDKGEKLIAGKIETIPAPESFYEDAATTLREAFAQ